METVVKIKYWLIIIMVKMIMNDRCNPYIVRTSRSCSGAHDVGVLKLVSFLGSSMITIG